MRSRLVELSRMSLSALERLIAEAEAAQVLASEEVGGLVAGWLLAAGAILL